MTPMQLDLHEARKARQYRFNSAAIELRQREHLSKQRQAQVERKAEQAREERQTIAAEQVAPDPVHYNRPASSVRKELLLQALEQHHLTLDELLCRRRRQDLVAARHELYARLHRFTRMSYPQIARFCGDRDHTTILHGVKKYNAALAAASCVEVA